MTARTPVTLGPHQTERIYVNDLLAKHRIEGSYGGLTIEPDHGHGSLQITHLGIDEAVGRSALLKVFPRSKLEMKASTLRAPMLALAIPDPALVLPEATRFEPRLFLFNAAERAIEVKPALIWRSGEAWGRVAVDPVSIPPRSTHLINIAKLQGKDSSPIPESANWATAELAYDGEDGDIVPLAASLSADGRYLIQTPFSDALSSEWRGSEWKVTPEHNALITVGNAGSKPAKVQFVLRHGNGSGRYELPSQTACA